MNTKLFLKHFSDAEDLFPKLKNSWSDDLRSVVISGELDICDEKGVYWDTYNIFLVAGSNYPFSVPILVENSKKIPRGKRRHISKEGFCCIDLEHILLKEARKGINICNFLKERVYPFFANQLYYEKEGKFANGEWDHNFEGVVQFYSTELNMKDPKLIVEFLRKLISNTLPERNDPCLCGAKKYKYCNHYDSMDFLSYLPKNRIEKDLEGFENLVAESI